MLARASVRLIIGRAGNTASIHDNYDIRCWQAQKPDSPLLLEGSSLNGGRITCVALDRGIAYMGTSGGEILTLKWERAITQMQSTAAQDSVWGPRLSLCRGNEIAYVDIVDDYLIAGSGETLFTVKPSFQNETSGREVARVTLPLFPREASIQIVRVVERHCRRWLLVVAHDPRQQKLYIMISPWEEGDTLNRYWNHPFSGFSFSDDDEKRSDLCKRRCNSLSDVISVRMVTYRGTILFLRSWDHPPAYVHWVYDVFTGRAAAVPPADVSRHQILPVLASCAGDSIYVSAAYDGDEILGNAPSTEDAFDDHGQCVRVFSVKGCGYSLSGSFAVTLVTGEEAASRQLERICRSLFQETSRQQLEKLVGDVCPILAMADEILLLILKQVTEMSGTLSARRFGEGPYESRAALRLTCRRFWNLISPRASFNVHMRDIRSHFLGKFEKMGNLPPIYALELSEDSDDERYIEGVDKLVLALAQSPELSSLSLRRGGKTFLAKAQSETLRRIRSADLVDIPPNLVHTMSNLRYLCWSGDTQTTLPELSQLEQLRLMISRPRSISREMPCSIQLERFPSLLYAHVEYITHFDPANVDDADGLWNDPTYLLKGSASRLRTLYIVNAYIRMGGFFYRFAEQPLEELYIGFSRGLLGCLEPCQGFLKLKYLGIIEDENMPLYRFFRFPSTAQTSVLWESQISRGKSRETAGDTLRRVFPSLCQ
ncbi:uncharacterized protein PV07_12604 [Cladophialophora immunda]|uniref:Uncharacterized protein n=1 Tax=Cladophialophora immunda TaxID=569365 RepID=A0A0D1Z319_9EURO|nr:uncharacterized protein PV07_12604 [Cladophialophora immunda]KIW21996.1 hypothetical protein PV07_12604 [Cladophialophora immunda]